MPTITKAILLREAKKHEKHGLIELVPMTAALEKRRYRRADIKRALLDLYRDGTMELRPESGLSRYTAEELARCPEGGHPLTPLSWGRLLVSAKPRPKRKTRKRAVRKTRRSRENNSWTSPTYRRQLLSASVAALTTPDTPPSAKTLARLALLTFNRPEPRGAK